MSHVELHILRSGEGARKLILSPGVVNVGRAEDNEVVLADVSVSRRHARIEVIAGGGLVIEDLGSGNGIWFAGRQVVRQVLGHGEQVTIDPFTLRFEVRAGLDTPDITEGRDETVRLPPSNFSASLTVVSAHKMPRLEYQLDASGVLSIGRSDKNGIVLPEPASSRVHAEVVGDGTGWLLRDFGSSNGTFVNARRVKERPLEDGDRIRIGTVELLFSLTQGSDGTEAFAGALVGPPPPVSRPAAPAPAPAPAPAMRPAPAPAMRPERAAGAAATELELNPSRKQTRSLSKGRPLGGGGFLSRPINRISLGLLAFTFVVVGGKVVSNMIASFAGPGGEASVPVAAARPAGASTLPAAPVPKSAVPAAPSEPLLAVAPVDSATTDAGMAEGMRFFAQSQYFEAAGAFHRVLTLDPVHRDAKRMGYVACEFIALAEVRAALVLRTTSDAARAEAKSAGLSALARALSGDQPVPEARVAVVAALAVAPNDPELMSALDEIDAKQASSARAATAGRAAAHSRELEAKVVAAQAELDRGAFGKAAKGFEAVLEADPLRASAQFYQAEEGLRTARDKMKSATKSAWVEVNTAMKVGDWLTARKRLDDVLKVNPYDESANAKLAEARKHLRADASEIYKEARVLEDMGQVEKALSLYHKVQLYVGDGSDALSQRAQGRMDGLLR